MGLLTLPSKPSELPHLNQPWSHSLSSQGEVSSPSQCRDLPWPHSGLSRSFISWSSQNWTLIRLQRLSLPRAGLCICPCWLLYDSYWPFSPAWTLFVAPQPPRSSAGYPAHSMGEHSITSSRPFTMILPLQLKYHYLDQCLEFWEGSASWKTDFHRRVYFPSHGSISTRFLEANNNFSSADLSQGNSSVTTLPQVSSLLPWLASHRGSSIDSQYLQHGKLPFSFPITHFSHEALVSSLLFSFFFFMRGLICSLFLLLLSFFSTCLIFSVSSFPGIFYLPIVLLFPMVPVRLSGTLCPP